VGGCYFLKPGKEILVPILYARKIALLTLSIVVRKGVIAYTWHMNTRLGV
jgi:hypothetical protein